MAKKWAERSSRSGVADTHDKLGNGEVEKFLDFPKIGAIIKKNWMVLRADPLRLRMLMIFPMVMILIFGVTAGKSPSHIPAAIADYDNTHESREVMQQLYSNDLFSISHLVGSQDEGRSLIENGDIKILFIIPQGFSNDLREGRTATLSIIVDESDPSVAQITRAFTQVFVQQVSKQLTTNRVKAVALQLRALGEYLSPGAGIAPDPQQDPGRGQDSAMALISSSYIDTMSTAASGNSMVESMSEKMENQLGMIFDPNEIEDEFRNGIMSPETAYALLDIADQQRYVMEQIGSYQALAQGGTRMSQDALLMYSASKEIYAELAMEKASSRIRAEMIDSAGKRADEIADSADAIPTEAIMLDEIEPYGSGRPALDFLIPSILALIVFQGAVMGMGRAIAGERQDGSLTRVFLTPTSNTTIIAGTLIFYMLFETIRSSLIVFAAMLIFGVVIKGSILAIIAVIAIYAAGSTGLGMILSVKAKSQEQYQALAMLVSLPTMFLAGVFLPIETMPPILQGVTRVLPITYAADALRGIMIKGFSIGQVVPDLAFLGIFAFLMLALSVRLFKRELL